MSDEKQLDTIDLICARLKVYHDYVANRITYGEAWKKLVEYNLTEYEAKAYLKH